MSVAKTIALIKALGGGSGGGSGGGYDGIVIGMTGNEEEQTLTATWGYINDAMRDGYPVFVATDDYVTPIVFAGEEDGLYYVLLYNYEGSLYEMTCNASSAHPSIGGGK